MRILLLDPKFLAGALLSEVEVYLSANATVFLNTFSLHDEESQLLSRSFNNSTSVRFLKFDARQTNNFLNVVGSAFECFDAIVIHPHVDFITPDVIRRLNANNRRDWRIPAILCPNDSISHLGDVKDYAPSRIVHTYGIHARSVAEYTLWQCGFHSRQLGEFYAKTGECGAWPHDDAISYTHSIVGKTLGVIGGTGRDGSAVIQLASHLGTTVLAVRSRQENGNSRLRAMGATVVDGLRELLSASDLLSINCRLDATTRKMIGGEEIARMKRHVIVVAPVGGDVFDAEALVAEFSRPLCERRIERLVIDMPFGGRRDDDAFRADPMNERLKRLGVLFTPRVAGYTRESYLAGVRQCVESFRKILDEVQIEAGESLSVQVASEKSGPLSDPAEVMEIVITAMKDAAEIVIRMRQDGLSVDYKADRSIVTPADSLVERMIRDSLRRRGLHFAFLGEEVQDSTGVNTDRMLIVDGIDGTRNFRDGNFGWCMSAAMIEKGKTLWSVVHDHHSDETYLAEAGGGAHLRTRWGSKRLCVADQLPEDFSFSIGSFRIKGSQTRKQQILESIKAIGGRERSWGSVALSICGVARGGLGVFIQGNSHNYDHVAGLLIAREAGFSIYSSPSQTGSTDIIVAHPTLFDRVVDIFS